MRLLVKNAMKMGPATIRAPGLYDGGAPAFAGEIRQEREPRSSGGDFACVCFEHTGDYPTAGEAGVASAVISSASSKPCCVGATASLSARTP